MTILVLGGGGREHALCWKIAASPLCDALFCSPGNAGIASVATCLPGEPVEVARQVRADLVVVGPDGLLAGGVVDRLNAAGFAAFGPTQSAARLESSKIWAKNLLLENHVPTARFAAFESAGEAKGYLETAPEGAFVVKADGLAVGKGVVMARSVAEAIRGVDEVTGLAAQTAPGDAGRVLIEEWMSGPEISFFALTDGQSLLPLGAVRDHKRAYDGDKGPNTGGMGCFAPVPAWTPQLQKQVVETILEPTLRGLRNAGETYRGVLYCGLMLTEEGPKVVEYNARFGDPECQILMALLEDDIAPVLLACAGVGDQRLGDFELKWREAAALLVVMAAQGYPGAVRKGDVISGLESVEDALVFHAGTKFQDGEVVTAGGRVLGVTALAPNGEAARAKAYAAVEKIGFAGAHYRHDIGASLT